MQRVQPNLRRSPKLWWAMLTLGFALLAVMGFRAGVRDFLYLFWMIGPIAAIFGAGYFYGERMRELGRTSWVFSKKERPQRSLSNNNE
ncbi:MAG: hypothetical protein KY429_03265 [Actinobacteria bacterium]|nr:hypothetical protein [Actinomycetota bacterium]